MDAFASPDDHLHTSYLIKNHASVKQNNVSRCTDSDATNCTKIKEMPVEIVTLVFDTRIK